MENRYPCTKDSDIVCPAWDDGCTVKNAVCPYSFKMSKSDASAKEIVILIDRLRKFHVDDGCQNTLLHHALLAEELGGNREELLYGLIVALVTENKKLYSQLLNEL